MRLLELAQFADRVAHQLVQHAAGRALPVELLAAQLVDALAVAGGALHQVAAKHLLHLRKTTVAQRIGEADHGRRLHFGGLGDGGDRAQRQVGGFSSANRAMRWSCLRHVRIDTGNRVLQLVVGGGAVHGI